MTSRVISLLSLALLWSAAVFVEVQAAELSDDIIACRSIESTAERLDCYDKAVDRRNQSVAKPQAAAATKAVVEPRVAAPAPATPATEDASDDKYFGLSDEEVLKAEKRSAGATDIEELKASVIRLRSTGSGKHLISLENGQLWQQTDSNRFRISVGDDVVIRKAALGSYMMRKAGSKRSIRVKRVN